MQVPFVDLAAEQAVIGDEVGDAVARVLQGTDWILGREVAAFEEEFARYCGTAYAVGTDSGLSALELALRAYGIGAGDEVVTAAHTFVATALAISHTGATPVLVDVDEKTHTIAPELLERAITKRTKAIIPVHLYGHPADMDAVLEIARAHGLVVIEDACQAHGARYDGVRVGSLADAGAFSFYPAKNLGAYGDGGILVTNDETVRDRVRMLRDYGQQEKYHHVVKGFNRRLDTLQAAVLRVKLRRLDERNAARRRHAELYSRLLAGTGAITPAVRDGVEHVWHLYVVRVAERAALRAFLADRGIATGLHYPIPVHLQAAYSDLGYAPGAFPVAEQLADEVLSLPMYAELTAAAIEHVAAAIADFYGVPAVRALGVDDGRRRRPEPPPGPGTEVEEAGRAL